MTKRIFSFLLALCLIVGLLPAVAIPHAHAETTPVSAKVTLFGTAVTIDNDETTTDIPDALYWADAAAGEDGVVPAPQAVTAEDAWNYSYTIVDGVPTVTLHNANYLYSARFLYVGDSATAYAFPYDINVVYIGENNVSLSDAKNKQFIHYYQNVTNGEKSHGITVIGVDEGEEKAELNATVKYKDGYFIQMRKVPLTIKGGTINVSKKKTGAVTNLVIDNGYGSLTIEDANLNVVNGTINSKGTAFNPNQYTIAPAVCAAGITIRNSAVTIESASRTALGVGSWNSGGSVDNPAILTIEDSTLTILNTKISDKITSNTYCAGIYAARMVIDNSEVLVQSKVTAVKVVGGNKIAAEVAVGDGLDMYLAADGDPVEEFATSTYFKVIKHCDHSATETAEQIVDATCVDAGSKTVTVTCVDCGEVLSETVTEIPSKGHTAELIPGTDATCTETGLTDGKKCAVCDEIIVAQEETPALGHTASEPVKENKTETDYEDVVYCSVCSAEISRTNVKIVKATLTLWGKNVSVDNDWDTADIPEAYYWIDKEGAAEPEQTIAADDWNYSFAIIDGMPTVTLRNADYSYSRSFLYAKYDGKLKLKYEGTNNAYVPLTGDTVRYFLKFEATKTHSTVDASRHLYIEGAEGAVLNVTGGDNSSAMIATAGKIYVTVSGGTLNVEKTNNGGIYGVVSFFWSPTTIENCNLTVKNNTITSESIGPQRPVLEGGYGGNSFYVKNSKVLVESAATVGLIAGVWDVNITNDAGKKVGGGSYMAALEVSGNSEVKVVNTYVDPENPNSGLGVYAKSVTIKGGKFIAEGVKQAVYTTSGAAPSLSSYTGEYLMFTEKFGTPVTEYAATTYFEIGQCAHEDVQVTEEITKAPTCTKAGSKKVITFCADCGVSQVDTVVIDALGHNEKILPAVDPTCTETGLTEGKQCTVCNEITVKQEVVPANGHTAGEIVRENIDPNTSYDEVRYCTVCGAEVSRETIKVVKQTFKLWGKSVTVDNFDIPECPEESALIPDAYYWIDGTDAPVAATAEDNWNYSIAIIDAVPTFTIRNANFNYKASMLIAKYDGKLKFVYEGTNNIFVPSDRTKGVNYYFMSYGSATDGPGNSKLYIVGGEDAVLNVTGGDNSVAQLHVYGKVYITISGGTINMERTIGDGVSSVINAPWCKTTIENCTLNVKNVSRVKGKHPAVHLGYHSGANEYGLTITNSNVNIETNGHIGLCVGAFDANMQSPVTYSGTLTINGDSHVYVKTSINPIGQQNYSGYGIYAKNIVMNGGELEAEGTKKAVYIASGDPINMTKYDGVGGYYNVYTEKGAEAVNVYQPTKYLKIEKTEEANHTCCEFVVKKSDVKIATCTEDGSHLETADCDQCGTNIYKDVLVIDPASHTWDDAYDIDCNVCGEIREVHPKLYVNDNNKLVLEEPNETHIYHRVTVYYLGDKDVDDITLENPLKEIDPDAKTYWTIEEINKVVLRDPGNYVLHLHYNTKGSPKIRYAVNYTLVEDENVPTIDVENGKLVVEDITDININHRATVYYLGAESVNNIYNVEALKAIDANPKTYWGMTEINKVLLTKSGNYVVVLEYNAGKNAPKTTVIESFTVVPSKPIVSRDGYKLKVTDSDATHKNHRATVYFVGDQTVDIYDEAALKAIDASAKTYWGLTSINKVQMATPGTYVIYLSYNLENGSKQTMVVKTTTRMPVPSVWLEENGQIGTIVPTQVAHRNYVIYYLGDQTVEDIYDIEALKAIDPDPIKFDNQKQIAERGVLTEKGNYVLVMYYNYVGSARQVIAEFATLK